MLLGVWGFEVYFELLLCDALGVGVRILGFRVGLPAYGLEVSGLGFGFRFGVYWSKDKRLRVKRGLGLKAL